MLSVLTEGNFQLEITHGTCMTPTPNEPSSVRIKLKDEVDTFDMTHESGRRFSVDVSLEDHKNEATKGKNVKGLTAKTFVLQLVESKR